MTDFSKAYNPTDFNQYCFHASLMRALAGADEPEHQGLGDVADIWREVQECPGACAVSPPVALADLFGLWHSHSVVCAELKAARTELAGARATISALVDANAALRRGLPAATAKPKPVRYKVRPKKKLVVVRPEPVVVAKPTPPGDCPDGDGLAKLGWRAIKRLEGLINFSSSFKPQAGWGHWPGPIGSRLPKRSTRNPNPKYKHTLEELCYTITPHEWQHGSERLEEELESTGVWDEEMTSHGVYMDDELCEAFDWAMDAHQGAPAVPETSDESDEEQFIWCE